MVFSASFLYVRLTFNHYTGKLISEWPHRAVSWNKGEEGEDEGDISRKVSMRFWLLSVLMTPDVLRSTRRLRSFRIFVQPTAPFSISLFLSFGFSLWDFFLVFCNSRWAVRPLVLRIGRSIFICFVSSAVFLWALEHRQPVAVRRPYSNRVSPSSFPLFFDRRQSSISIWSVITSSIDCLLPSCFFFCPRCLKSVCFSILCLSLI